MTNARGNLQSIAIEAKETIACSALSLTPEVATIRFLKVQE